MSNLLSLRSMDVITLENGYYGVRVMAPEALPRIIGGFDTREEADAWILQRTMLEDEAVMGGAVLTPGPSLNII